MNRRSVLRKLLFLPLAIPALTKKPDPRAGFEWCWLHFPSPECRECLCLQELRAEHRPGERFAREIMIEWHRTECSRFKFNRTKSDITEASRAS